MPPQTNVYVTAPQASQAKGVLSLFKSKAGFDQSWSTIRGLGQPTRRASRRPVFE